MDLYVSKQCQHCAQLLTLLRDNPNLQPYFIIKPIESNPYPKELKVVPTLVKDNQLYTGKELNSIVNDVNRYDMERNGQHQQQQQQQPQQPIDDRDMQLQQFSNRPQQQQQQQQQQQIKKNPEDDDIMGICSSEGCLYESIDNGNDNYLNSDYCFLDDGYSEKKPTESNNSGGGKTGRFDNSAYEAMMKSRQM